MSRKLLKFILVVFALLASFDTLAGQGQIPKRLRVVVSPPPSGVNNIGTVTLSSTFDSISVQAVVLSDTDNDATGTFEFRTTGSGTWNPAYTPDYDNRATLFGGTTNPNVDQMRGSIVGLTAGTSYDVRITVTDPDLGAGQTIASVSTLSLSPPFGGTTRYVDDVGSNGDGSSGSPFNTLTACQTAASAGDTCFIRNGTYPAFTFTKSGTSSAWLKWEGESQAGVIIQGGAVTRSVLISADFLYIKNITTQLAQRDTIEVSATTDHVFLDTVRVSDVSSTKSYGDAAVKLIGGASDIYILNSTILCPSCTYAVPRSEGPISGIESNGGTTNIVVKGTTIDGRFRDGIAQTPENFGGGFLGNSDFANNVFLNVGDDNIQLEGNSNNVRAWGNRITGGTSCLATQESYIGPVYFFRNLCVLADSGTGPTGWKGHNGATTFFFHNTFEVTVSGSDLVAAGTAFGVNVGRNNILFSNGAANPIYGTSATFNYDVLHRTTNTVLVSDSFGSAGFWENVGPGSDLYVTTGQELNGVEGNPNLQGTLKTILNTSNAYNNGVTLPNFNDAASAWPAVNGAPDRGYYEVP